MQREIEYDFQSKFNDDYSIPTRKILRMLSENSRTSITKMASQLGLSRRTTKKRLSNIEKTLDTNYTLEFNERALGLPMPHLVVLEFQKKPDYKYVTKLLEKSYIPQLAFTIKDKNQICVYAVATSPDDYAYWDNAMDLLLFKYGMNLYSSEIAHKQLGFVPLRNELIDKLNIDPSTKNLIKLLNENSRASIQRLSKSLGKHFNTITYAFDRLVKSGYIKRFTLTIGRQEGMVPARFLMKYRGAPNRERDSAKARLAIKYDDKYSMVNRYIFNASMVGSLDHFGIGVFDNYKTGYEHCLMYYKQTMGRHIVNMYFNAIDKVLLGRLPLRSIDVKADYNTMEWTADIEKL